MLGQFHVTKWVEAVAEVSIPPFAVTRIRGAVWENPGRTVLQVDKCDVDNDFPVAVNSHQPMAAGKPGMVAIEGVVYVLYDDSSTPDNGQLWGPQASSFEIKEGNTGFVILGDVDTERGIVLVNISGTSDGEVGGCLAENHPGRGVVFDLHLGHWSSSLNKWLYDTGTVVPAIDWRHGVPYPSTGATGLFRARPSDEHGIIYETLALDCTSPGACGS
jgi:hypothetical protein